MNDTQKPKLYKQAPLPFAGQKRFFLTHFRKILDENIKGEGEGWTIIDVFGGSGLLSNNAKHCKPQARVIYNDFDNYCERLKHIDDSNRLRKIIYQALEHLPNSKKIPKDCYKQIKNILTSFDGHLDMRAVSSWLLFSGNHANTIDELFSHTLYNTVRKSDYPQADSYLTGIEVVSQSYEKLLPQFINQQKTLLLFDPPYVSTSQGAYKNAVYFGMVQFLELMQFVRPPYIFFSSTKSELLDYMEFVKKYKKDDWNRFGNFEKISFTTHVNRSSHYEDNMLFKFAK